ncbi:MAG: hypothetical protein DHS20C08_12870 [Rhodomicrobium sp.]|nr:MAG: hypothetical protein DHS20C08_12870 [Rhodomicrobium sp.]
MAKSGVARMKEPNMSIALKTLISVSLATAAFCIFLNYCTGEKVSQQRLSDEQKISKIDENKLR